MAETSEPTEGEVVAIVAEESPEAAGLLTALMLQSARDREAMMPTWEALWKAEQDAYERGFRDGARSESDRIYRRVFGGAETLYA